MLKTLCLAATALLLSSYASAASINAPETPTAEEMTARGVLRASQTAEIAAGMSGRLLEAGYKPGQYFKAGTLLAEFDCTRQEAELAAAVQAKETMRIRHENSAELFTLGAAGELDVTLAKSERQHAAATAEAMRARLRDCAVYAPFSGYVTQRHKSAFETPQAGQPLYSLQRAGALELSVITPSKWMKWMDIGQQFHFTIDETGESFTAKIIRTGAAVDPVSQTIEITARPIGKTKALAGMSGIARFQVP